MDAEVRVAQNYAKEFAVIQYGMSNNCVCDKTNTLCKISISKAECRECVEQLKGLKDVFNGD